MSKHTKRAFIAHFELLILRDSALLDFHRVLHRGNSIRDYKVFTLITKNKLYLAVILLGRDEKGCLLLTKKKAAMDIDR